MGGAGDGKHKKKYGHPNTVYKEKQFIQDREIMTKIPCSEKSGNLKISGNLKKSQLMINYDG